MTRIGMILGALGLPLLVLLDQASGGEIPAALPLLSLLATALLFVIGFQIQGRRGASARSVWRSLAASLGWLGVYVVASSLVSLVLVIIAEL